MQIFLTAIYHNIGIQIKKKELTKTFMMISNLKKPLSFPWFMQTYFIVVSVNDQSMSAVIQREDGGWTNDNKHAHRDITGHNPGGSINKR